MSEAADGFAHMATVREDKINEQLKDVLLRKTAGDDKHPRIAVLQGMAHTRSAHLVSAEGHSVVRKFLPEAPELGRTKAVFTYWDEAIRRRKFRPNEQLKPEFLNRVLLEWYARPLQKDMKQHMSETASIYALRELIDRFDDTEVAQVLTRITAQASSELAPEVKQKNAAESIARQIIAKLPAASEGKAA